MCISTLLLNLLEQLKSKEFLSRSKIYAVNNWRRINYYGLGLFFNGAKLISPIVAKVKTTISFVFADLLVPEFDGFGELVDGHEEVLDDPLLGHVHPSHQALLQPHIIKGTVHCPVPIQITLAWVKY